MVVYNLSINLLNLVVECSLRLREGIPQRWKHISAAVEKSIKPDDSPRVNIGSGTKTIKLVKSIEARDIKQINQIIYQKHPSLLQQHNLDLLSDNFDEDGNSAKSIILAPPMLTCLDENCKHSKLLPIPRSKHQSPIIYTNNGSRIAYSFRLACENCNAVYYHSYYTKDDKKHFYSYDIIENSSFILITEQTGFEMEYLNMVDEAVALAGNSFEILSIVYNQQHSKKHSTALKHASRKGRRKVKNEKRKLDLNNERLEEAFFIKHLIIYLTKKKVIYKHNFKANKPSNRPPLEKLCKIANLIYQSNTPEWIHHSCTVKGCKEGFLAIDGNCKIRRVMCGCDRFIILGPGTPRIIQACPKSPARSNKKNGSHQFCKEHMWIEKALAGDFIFYNFLLV